ncbi:methylated-DNA--cysteine S-met [Polychytrium aggregatum]|uniref:methylated-DNA--cysteine S-met n=1 Tax=Polychytrium aggregatum TaxID=110093 RepID=UPI0022FE1BCF|nr:methylated-DNA--cysteine S-met [Polychytrium aggregatum]KAI9205273.1 methylated-DNA--cysteine S-met [Polychytrium aggregatum]
MTASNSPILDAETDPAGISPSHDDDMPLKYPSAEQRKTRVIRNKHTGRPVTEFQYKVYDLIRQIPAGSVATYRDVSAKLHSSPRAVGQALKVNPWAPYIPCHRVLASNYYIGGFFGDWGHGDHINRKLKLLSDEGIHIDADGFVEAEQRASCRHAF